MSNHPDIKYCWGIVDDGVPMEHCKKHNQIYKNYCSKCVIEENEKLKKEIQILKEQRTQACKEGQQLAAMLREESAEIKKLKADIEERDAIIECQICAGCEKREEK